MNIHPYTCEYRSFIPFLWSCNEVADMPWSMARCKQTLHIQIPNVECGVMSHFFSQGSNAVISSIDCEAGVLFD